MAIPEWLGWPVCSDTENQASLTSHTHTQYIMNFLKRLDAEPGWLDIGGRTKKQKEAARKKKRKAADAAAKKRQEKEKAKGKIIRF